MPIDRGAIDAQLKEIGEGERWWELREFRDLPYILHAEERMRGISRGKLLGRRRPRLKPAPWWLIVATDQRIICLKQERFARKQIDIAPGQVIRVNQASRLRSVQITIQTAQRTYRIRIPKANAYAFAPAVAPFVPAVAPPPLHAALEPLSWLPGINTVAALPGVAGIVSRVSMLSPPDQPNRSELQRIEATLDRLQSDVERLQQQVEFLEDLLERRADGTMVAPPAIGS
jgi:hypothetical protein